MDVEFHRVDHEVGELEEVTSLLSVVFFVMAEESVAALTAFVRESEDHIRTVT